MQASKSYTPIFYPLIIVFYLILFFLLFPIRLNYVDVNNGIYTPKKLPAYDFINKYFYYLENCKDGIFFIGPSTVREAFNNNIDTDATKCIINGGVSSNGDIYFLAKQLSILENNLPKNYKIPLLIVGLNSRMIVDRSGLGKPLGFDDFLSIEQMNYKYNYLDQVLFDINLKKKYILFKIIHYANKYNFINTKNNITLFKKHYKNREFDEVRFNNQVRRFKENGLWSKEKYFNQKEISTLHRIVDMSHEISNNTIFYIMPYHSVVETILGNDFEKFLPKFFSENKILFIDNTSSFNDSDLIDFGHLNEQGREKFQQLLISNIKSITEDSLP